MLKMKSIRKKKNKKINKNRNNYNNEVFNESSRNLIKLPKNRNLYINESLYQFNKLSNNVLLDELITNIIEFRKSFTDKKIIKSFPLSAISSNFLLFHHIEKNLIEISYLPDIETRNSKILFLYRWYRNILKKHNSLKNIISKSYVEENPIYNIINNDNNVDNKVDNNNVDNNAENNAENTSTYNNNKDSFNEKENIKKILNKKSRIASMKYQKSKLFNENENSKWDFMTHLYCNKNCSNNSTIQKDLSSFFIENILNLKSKLISEIVDTY